MKYKLLSVRGKNATNIGDYIQALASAQFLPTIDGFINREELSEYEEEECKIILNGWFMHNAMHWPPSEKIHPLFVAFHLNSSVADQMLSNEGIKYFKDHSPIGCRDLNTELLLKKHGIDAYFSGCMTLTLGRKYMDSETDPIDYFVDPVIPKSRSLIAIIQNIVYYFLNIKDVEKVLGKLYYGNKLTFKRRLISAGFLRLYSKWFDKKNIVDAEYISQENQSYKNQFHKDSERLKEAERLIRLYARARLVVTSRIHCALPCLGLKTPVIFISNSNDSEISKCRFGNLIDLFNVMECTPYGLQPKFELKKAISVNNIPHNKDSWKEYAANLSSACENFMAAN